MSKKISSDFNSSSDGDKRTKPLDVCDVPTELLKLQFFTQEIQRLTRDTEVWQLAQRIEKGLDPCISAMASAVEQLAEVA